MKAFMSFGIAVLVGLAACGGGGGGGGSKSFSELKSKFDNPTGDLGPDNAKSVAAALQEEQQNSQGMGKLGLSSVQGAQSGNPIDCSNYTQGSTSITCTCNGGGTVGAMTSAPQEGDPIAVAYEYNSCAMQYDDCTSTVDGTGWYLTTYGDQQGEYCFSFNGNVSPCGEPSQSLSVEYCYLGGQRWYLVELEGAYFAVNGTVYDNGAFDITVKDKDGEWHCVSQDGQTGTCDGPGGSFSF